MTQIRSAALIVNAMSRSGRRQFKQACRALKSLPYPVDAYAVKKPENLEATIGKALAKQPDLIILGRR